MDPFKKLNVSVSIISTEQFTPRDSLGRMTRFFNIWLEINDNLYFLRVVENYLCNKASSWSLIWQRDELIAFPFEKEEKILIEQYVLTKIGVKDNDCSKTD